MNREIFWLSEAQFARLEPLLPTDTRSVARVDDCRVISGIVHFAHHIQRLGINSTRYIGRSVYLRRCHTRKPPAPTGKPPDTEQIRNTERQTVPDTVF